MTPLSCLSRVFWVIFLTGLPIVAATAPPAPQELSEWGLQVVYIPLSGAIADQLRLTEPGALVVTNLRENSPAHKADLKRYDLLIRWDNQVFRDHEEWTTWAAPLTTQTSLPLEVVHQNQRRPVRLERENATAQPPTSMGEWIYPVLKASESHGEASQDPAKKLPGKNKFPKNDEVYTYTYTDEETGEEIEITITGDPFNKKKTQLTIRQGEEDYDISADAIDSLPEELQETARNALASAQFNTAKPQGQPNPLLGPPIVMEIDPDRQPHFLPSYVEKLRRYREELLREIRAKEIELQKLRAAMSSPPPVKTK